MMAFYTEFTESGQKRFYPTLELREVLKQDRITAKDLQPFRSSNKVQQLMTTLLAARGFERNHSTQEWVRSDVRGDDGVMPSKKKSFISQVADGLSMLTSAQIVDGVSLSAGDKVLLKNQEPKKVSVAERVSVAVCAFMKEVGRNPNKLWISGADWHELTGGAVHFKCQNIGGPRTYQGMKVELMGPGTELFVGIAAGGAVEKSEGKLQTGQILSMPHGEEFEQIVAEMKKEASWISGETEAVKQVVNPKPTCHVTELDIEAAMYQKALLKALEASSSALSISGSAGPAPQEDEATAAPAPAPAPERKRITPPSQLKRKLAL